jgi:hypothetical protein
VKKWIILFVLFHLSLSPVAKAEDFLGLPVLPGGRTVKSSGALLEKSYDMTAPAAIQFYKDNLRGQPDLKLHDNRQGFVIEDHGRLPWHQVVILETVKGHTSVQINKDSWTWILGTLFIRFLGVFVVLMVLYFAMAFATGFIVRSARRGG